jgi:hypothetical protein
MQIILIFALREDGILVGPAKEHWSSRLRRTLELRGYIPASVSKAKEIYTYKR